MYCTNCGKEIENSSLFCTYCGSKVQKPQEAVQPVQPGEAAQPVQQEEAAQPLQQEEAAPKKKNPAPIIALIVALLVVIAGGAFAAIRFVIPSVTGKDAIADGTEAGTEGAAGAVTSTQDAAGATIYMSESLDVANYEGLDNDGIYAQLSADCRLIESEWTDEDGYIDSDEETQYFASKAIYEWGTELSDAGIIEQCYFCEESRAVSFYYGDYDSLLYFPNDRNNFTGGSGESFQVYTVDAEWYLDNSTGNEGTIGGTDDDADQIEEIKTMLQSVGSDGIRCIFWKGNGAVYLGRNGETLVGLVTGAYSSDGYEDDYKNGYISRTENGGYYVLNNYFFDTYLGEADGGLFYCASSYSYADDGEFASVFLNHGFEAFCGADFMIDTSYASQMMTKVAEYLAAPDENGTYASIADVLTIAQNELGEQDDNGGHVMLQQDSDGQDFRVVPVVIPAIEDQVAFFAEHVSEWSYEGITTGAIKYFITDCDQDGLLEIIANNMMGTGFFTESHVYEVDKDLSQLTEIYRYVDNEQSDVELDGFADFAEDNSEDDMLYIYNGYYDPDKGRWYYMEYNYIRYGWVENTISYYLLYMEEDRINCSFLGYVDNVVDETTYEETAAYYVGDSEVAEDSFYTGMASAGGFSKMLETEYHVLKISSLSDNYDELYEQLLNSANAFSMQLK